MKYLLALVIILTLIVTGCSSGQASRTKEFKLFEPREEFITIYNPQCADTDNGIMWFTKGIVSGTTTNSTFNFTDECRTDQELLEYYCAGDTPQYTITHCYIQDSERCYDGACISSTNQSNSTCLCNYHSSSEPFEFEYSLLFSNEEGLACEVYNQEGPETLRFCYDNDQEFQTFNCFDSDGGQNINTYGFGTFNTIYRNTTVTNSTWTDGCQGIGVRENWCENDDLWSGIFACNNCVNGACRTKPGSKYDISME